MLQQPTPDMVIDVVDAADHVVGAAQRRDILRLRQGFRVAHVFLFNSKGDLLLQRLAPTRNRHPSRWGSSVAAYLFAGETYDQAARRRVEQELSIHSVELKAALRTSMLDDGCTKWISLFCAVSDGPFHPDPTHISDLAFRPMSKIDHDLTLRPTEFTPTFVHLFRQYRSHAMP